MGEASSLEGSPRWGVQPVNASCAAAAPQTPCTDRLPCPTLRPAATLSPSPMKTVPGPVALSAADGEGGAQEARFLSLTHARNQKTCPTPAPSPTQTLCPRPVLPHGDGAALQGPAPQFACSVPAPQGTACLFGLATSLAVTAPRRVPEALVPEPGSGRDVGTRPAAGSREGRCLHPEAGSAARVLGPSPFLFLQPKTQIASGAAAAISWPRG